MKKIYLTLFLFFFLIPMLIFIGIYLLHDRSYLLISFCIFLCSMLPLWIQFEKKEANTRRLILLAVMTAISVVGRCAFAPIPGFKPVTAIVTITALSFGAEAGFVVGSCSALVSNLFFGQGPWTPFQMFAWGMIGFVAGVFRKPLLRSKLLLLVYGILAGILFSFLMDIWTVLSIDGHFSWQRYLAALLSAIPFTFTYALSNVLFLIFLATPIGKRLERIQTKYLD